MNGAEWTRDRMENISQRASTSRVKTLNFILQATGSLQRVQKKGSKNYFRDDILKLLPRPMRVPYFLKYLFG